ncbi:unnamed protein product [Agarophyton chilense]
MEAQAGKPRDARIIEAILRAMGVDQYDPRVVNQLLELLYRYVSGVLIDARNVCEHTFKQQIDAEDIKLAIKATCSHSFLQPPPREVTMRIAAERNSVPLPQVDQMAGLSLPKPEYQLTEQNYDFVFEKKPTSPIKRTSPTVHAGASPNKRQRLSPHQRPHTEPPRMLNRSPNSGTYKPTAAIASKNDTSPVKKTPSPIKATPLTNSSPAQRSPLTNSAQSIPGAILSTSPINTQKPQQTLGMQTISTSAGPATQRTLLTAPMASTAPTTLIPPPPPTAPTAWNQPNTASTNVQQPDRQGGNAGRSILPTAPPNPPAS